MSSRTRVLVMSLSAPIVAFAIVGGLLGRVAAREDTYQNLKMFEDVVQLIDNNYVEKVDENHVMNGALHGLADNLDAESAFLTPAEVGDVERGAPLPGGELGITLTRQYYLRIIATRDGSPAAAAGLRTGDYIRAIDDRPTRDMSVWEGVRALRGKAGTTVHLTVFRSSQNDLHEIEVTRAAPAPASVSGRVAAPGVGYLRVAAIGPSTAADLKARAAELTKAGATTLVLDLRRTSTGTFDQGVALARLFVSDGTLTIRESKAAGRAPIAAASGDGAITAPIEVLMDTGTSGPAEVLAAALAGNGRADLFGEHTIGRAAEQTLVKLPDGSGLWLSTSRFLTPAGTPIHDTGLEPDVEVEQPRVEFGQPDPTEDPILDKALEKAAARAAATPDKQAA
jgi:carboxyl-terminal processing protease